MNNIEDLKQPTPQTTIPTPLRHAARAGIFLGLFFTIVYSCFIYSFEYPVLIYLFILGALYIPFLVYRTTKGYRDVFFKEQPFPFRVAWVHGTWLYLFSSIVVLPAVYIFYTRILPEALPMIQQAFEQAYEQYPNLKGQFAETFGAEPIKVISDYTSSEYLFGNLMSFLNQNFIIGALLSLITGMLLRRN